ncbi:aa3-type cytochrome c oxidase subunit IV [Roseomonas sp. AR75]|uniref:aa3-type cytochrome c oxidase subunit IV n=1 Tax=Roseomonas sp. AR75 TaxID=2562311 RepID=UPI0014850C8A|nr:aa3-type cytochrome c oxidase subunit IV [Roseomonas sp. AR75]
MADHHGPTTMELVTVRSDDIIAERRSFYESFMTATSWAIGATVLVLVLMWIFLV